MGAMNEKNLDIEAMRALAIAITFVAHIGDLIPAWYGWTSYFWLGGGVDLFFAISGFVIVRGLSSTVVHDRDFRQYALRFWTRRMFRLWPAALFWSTLVMVMSNTLPLTSALGSRADVFYSWLFGLLNVENLYINVCSNLKVCSPTPLWHYWSLSLEEQFYLLVPCLLFVTRARAFLIPLFLLAAFAQGLAHRPWESVWWFIRTDALLYGCVVALIWHHYPKAARRMTIFRSDGIARVVLLLSLLALVLSARDAWVPLHMGAVALSAGISIAIASGNRNLLTGSEGAQRLASYFGSRSYSIYLVHNPVLNLTRQAIYHFKLLSLQTDWERALAVLLALAVSVVLAEISYKVIEMPLRRYGRELTERSANRAAPAKA